MAEKVKTKCPLCGDVLSAGGYEAEFSADIGATCFRLFYKPLNAEILRTPNGESQRNTNVYLFGNKKCTYKAQTALYAQKQMSCE